MLTIRVAGANGEGIDTTGVLLAKILGENGLYVFGNRGYQSLVRGGHVWYQVALDTKKLNTFGSRVDILVAFNEEAVNYHKGLLKEDSILVYDPNVVKADLVKEIKCKKIELKMSELAKVTKNPSLMKNTVAIGSVLKILGIEIESIKKILKKIFSDKGEEVINENIKAAEEGYKAVEKVYSLKGGKRKIVLDGNTAIALGAVAAGLDFFAAYPMTPASGILHFLAQNQEKLNVFVKQFEDEIAVANATIGAAYAGARAMCATSGGGLSLMTEATSFAGMSEIGVVFVDSQRTGPSTGFPTKTDQSDLNFILGIGQGDWPRIIIAPTSVEECFYAAAEALNLAQKYQTPVFILLDQYLSERLEAVDSLDVEKIRIEEPRIAKENKDFKRYKVTEDGISPVAFPGMEGFEHTASSYEHDEYGNSVADIYAGLPYAIENRKKQHEKRMRKLQTAKKDAKLPELIGNEKAEITFVCWGSTKGAVEEAVEKLKEKGIEANAYAFEYIFPLNEEVGKILRNKKLIDVEENISAQFAKLLKREFGIDFKGYILHYTGEPITSEEIIKESFKFISKKKSIIAKLKEEFGFVE
ncbi:MAG: 2-oxoacid:acceptor oxidoreductase subunit alpha [Candidatus Micrarchaeales archaeon]